MWVRSAPRARRRRAHARSSFIPVGISGLSPATSSELRGIPRQPCVSVGIVLNFRQGEQLEQQSELQLGPQLEQQGSGLELGMGEARGYRR